MNVNTVIAMEQKAKIFLVPSIYSVICDPSEQHKKMLGIPTELHVPLG